MSFKLFLKISRLVNKCNTLSLTYFRVYLNSKNFYKNMIICKEETS